MKGKQNTDKPVVFITGASAGIGKALALQYAAHGYNLVLSARRRDLLEQVAGECSVYHAECFILEMDVTQKDTIAEKINQALHFFGRIDVLVNNAGVSQRSTALETEISVMQRIMEINFYSAINITRILLPELKRNHGRIVVMSSFSGLFGFPLRSAYAASKFALHGFFETLRLEERDISVTIACPGRIRTDISLNALVADGSPQQEMDPGIAAGISPQYCAKKIYTAAKKRRHLVLIAKGERIVLFFKKYIPFVFYFLVKRISAK